MRFEIIAAAVVPLLTAAGMRLYMGRPAEDRLRPGERVVIAELPPPLPGNAFLVCPAGYCAVAAAAGAPEFAISAARLQQCWRQLLAGERHVAEMAAEPQAQRIVYIAHTPLLRFPDIVTVEFVALAAERSCLAVYSRARYGRADFGINRRRVEAWLRRLAAAIAALQIS